MTVKICHEDVLKFGGRGCEEGLKDGNACIIYEYVDLSDSFADIPDGGGNGARAGDVARESGGDSTQGRYLVNGGTKFILRPRRQAHPASDGRELFRNLPSN